MDLVYQGFTEKFRLFENFYKHNCFKKENA